MAARTVRGVKLLRGLCAAGLRRRVQAGRPRDIIRVDVIDSGLGIECRAAPLRAAVTQQYLTVLQAQARSAAAGCAVPLSAAPSSSRRLSMIDPCKN